MPPRTPETGRIRVMMIGPYPLSRDRIDGGVASATTYLSEALATKDGIDLIGVRIVKGHGAQGPRSGFQWPIEDLPLGRFSLSSLYRRQRERLRQLITRHRPHVVHAQGTDIAGFLAVGCGLPSVVTVHGLLGECASYQTNFVMKARAKLTALLTERHSVRRATDLIAISPYVTRYYAGQFGTRVHAIPNPIAPSFFGVQRNPEAGRLLYAGRIANGKGLPDLLRAVARNRAKTSAVVLAGATPDAGYGRSLRRQVMELGLTDLVYFAGLLDEPTLLKEFSRAEALVLPSRQETAPMVVQQAMAAGLAVVATRVGGIPEQIENESTGLLFDAGDVDALAGILARLDADASLGRRLGEAAAQVAMQRFPAAVVAQATLRVYQGALAARPRANRP
jgi:glycosyltransferase involved in cell wall biosynthesis